MEARLGQNDEVSRRSLLNQFASVFSTPRSPEDFLRLIDPLASSRQLRGLVTEVIPETADSATIRFRPGRGWTPHEAGQWARIGIEIDGVRHWRSYSLSTAAGHDPAITVTARGQVSEALVHGTKVGDVLFLAVPEGDFTLPDQTRPLLMLTAGSGLTPVMSMIRTLVPRRSDVDLVLVHAAPSPEESLFREELLELADQSPGFRVVEWFREHRGRRLDLSDSADLDEACPDWRERAAYACGPSSFLEVAQARWEASGLGLRIERFAAVTAEVHHDDGGLVTFEASDTEAEAGPEDTLLETGERAGLLLPSGCRMGICHACLCPLTSGRVRDTRTGELHGEPGHLIQTCVSTPVGPVSLSV